MEPLKLQLLQTSDFYGVKYSQYGLRQATNDGSSELQYPRSFCNVYKYWITMLYTLT